MSSPNSDGEDLDFAGQTDEQTDNSVREDRSVKSGEPDDSGGPDEASTDVDTPTRDAGPGDTVTDLEAEMAALRAETDELRSDYARGRAATHRRTALALAAIGVIAVLGGIAFSDVRAVLFVTGSIGLFGGVLTWYLTPERVLPVDVSESVYDATASTLRGMRDELGLQPLTVYVPVENRVRGFIPRRRAFELPENLSHVFATDDGVSRGVSFAPTGGRLASESERIRRTRPPATAVEAAEQLGDTLVEHFEVAGGVTVEDAGEPSALTVSVEDPAFGSVTRVDHPVVSTLACGIVRATDEPVAVEPIDDTTVVFETDLGEPDEST